MKRILRSFSTPAVALVTAALLVVAGCGSSSVVTTSEGAADPAAATVATVGAGDGGDAGATTALQERSSTPTCPNPTALPDLTATPAPNIEDVPLPPVSTSADEEVVIDPTTLAIMAAGPTPVPTVEPTSTPIVALGAEPGAAPATVPDSAGLPVGTFLLYVNGAETTGSGIAFVESTETFVRLLAGTDSKHLEFGLEAVPNSGVQFGQVTPAVIYGGDAVGMDYEPAHGSASDAAFVMVDGGDGTVHGTFDTAVCHYTRGGVERMIGVYRVAASASTEWTCDLGTTSIENCRFLDG